MPSNKTSTPGYLRDVKEAREDSHNVRVLLYGWVTEYNAMKVLRIGHHVVDKDGDTLTIVKTGVGDRLHRDSPRRIWTVLHTRFVVGSRLEPR